MVKMGEHIDRKYVYRFNFTLREISIHPLDYFDIKKIKFLSVPHKTILFSKKNKRKTFFSYLNSARGVFYVETFNNFPYGQGEML